MNTIPGVGNGVKYQDAGRALVEAAGAKAAIIVLLGTEDAGDASVVVFHSPRDLHRLVVRASATFEKAVEQGFLQLLASAAMEVNDAEIAGKFPERFVPKHWHDMGITEPRWVDKMQQILADTMRGPAPRRASAVNALFGLLEIAVRQIQPTYSAVQVSVLSSCHVCRHPIRPGKQIIFGFPYSKADPDVVAEIGGSKPGSVVMTACSFECVRQFMNARGLESGATTAPRTGENPVTPGNSK